MSAQSYRQKWWIYYALRNSAFDACNTLRADNNGVKLTAMKSSFEWYQICICSHRKVWVNCIWTMVTTRIPPSFRPNLTRIGYDVIFQTAFRPLNVLFFSLKICSDMPSSNTQGTLWPDFWNWSRGPLKTPFCPVNLFYITCFDRIIIETREWFTITTMNFFSNDTKYGQ